MLSVSAIAMRIWFRRACDKREYRAKRNRAPQCPGLNSKPSLANITLAFVLIVLMHLLAVSRLGAQTVSDATQIQSTTYHSACGPTADYNEANLCEQRRAADAAAASTRWAKYQTIFGVVGLLLVLATFGAGTYAAIASSRSAQAATKSAEAAERTFTLMQKTAERQLRAYISVTLKSFKILRIDKRYFIETVVVVSNTGQTPAYDVAKFFAFRKMPWPLPSDDQPEWPTKDPVPTVGIINANSSIDIGLKQFVDLGATPPAIQQRLYLIGVITFKDAFVQIRSLKFYGSFENTAQLIELANSGSTGSVKSTFAMDFQTNLDP